LDSWQRAAVEAQTAGELLKVARECIATFTPAEMASIPEPCRPDRIKGIDDLHHWQQRLAESYCELAAHSAPSSAHTRLLSFLTLAVEAMSALGCADAANDGRRTRTFQR
jgi:hypothetical protein